MHASVKTSKLPKHSGHPLAARSALIVVAAIASALGSACRTTSSTLPPSPANVGATRSVATGTWELRDGSEVLGRVVRMETVEAPARITFMVQNRDGQDLGLIDALGRAWRYRAHERDPEWITTGTVLQGTRAILDVRSGAELVEIDAGGVTGAPASRERDGG